MVWEKSSLKMVNTSKDTSHKVWPKVHNVFLSSLLIVITWGQSTATNAVEKGNSLMESIITKAVGSTTSLMGKEYRHIKMAIHMMVDSSKVLRMDKELTHGNKDISAAIQAISEVMSYVE